MSHSENDWFDFFKDRRFVPVFFVTLAVIFSGLIAGSICLHFLLEFQLERFLIYACPGLMFLLGVLILKAFRSRRASWRNRYKTSPLSRDEVSKARSKLVKQK